MVETRRDFLKTVGFAATLAAASSLPGLAEAKGRKPWSHKERSEERFWREVEKAFTLDKDLHYHNIGGTGTMPRHVLDGYDKLNRESAKDPAVSGNLTTMRELVAPGLGASPDEIVLTTNTTDGMCMSLNGLDWEPGDEIISTNMEHPGGNGPMSQMAARKGVVIRRVMLPTGPDQDPEEYVDLFRALINNNTKAICFSHIPYLTGTLLPAKRLCELAIDNGLVSIIDGAHVTGMLNVNFRDLGVDLYAGSGHKWQCGPRGTGIWYVRNQRQSNPLELPMVWGVLSSQNAQSSRYAADGSVRNIGAFLQSHGNTNDPAWNALTDSCLFWEEIGRARIEEYVVGLGLYLKERIQSIFGRHALMNPDLPELSSGITTINPFQDKTNLTKINTVVQRLSQDYNIVVVSRSFGTQAGPTHRAVRISTHLFHNRGDVDRIVDAVVALVNELGDD